MGVEAPVDPAFFTALRNLRLPELTRSYCMRIHFAAFLSMKSSTAFRIIQPTGRSICLPISLSTATVFLSSQMLNRTNMRRPY